LSIVAVTVVDSGSRALQYLGLEEDNNSARFDVSSDFDVLPELFKSFLLLLLTNFVVKMMQDLKVNLIMTDYSMPGMTGFELLKKIKVCNLILFSFQFILTFLRDCRSNASPVLRFDFEIQTYNNLLELSFLIILLVNHLPEFFNVERDTCSYHVF